MTIAQPYSRKVCTCGNEERIFSNEVVDSRKVYLKRAELYVIRRRRVCSKCHGRFGTYEMDLADINLV
jgi:transcriptional regulator NrdR family protein